MEWYEQPSSINELKKVNYLFAIDENGTSTLKNANKFDDTNKWFTITGILIDPKHFNSIKEDITDLKEKYWLNGMHKGKRVILHSRDIRKKQGAFNPSIINTEKFNEDLNDLLSGMPIKVFSANFDKYKHWAQYNEPFPVYELGVEFIIERFSFEMRRKNKNGVILFESIGRREDQNVLQKMKKLIASGNDYISKDNFNCISGVHFNPKRTNDGKMSYWPLEVADMVSYCIYQKVKNNKETEVFQSIKEKIFGYPEILGRGLKIFP